MRRGAEVDIRRSRGRELGEKGDLEPSPSGLHHGLDGAQSGDVVVPPPPGAGRSRPQGLTDQAVWALNSAYCLSLAGEPDSPISAWEIYQNLKLYAAGVEPAKEIEHLATHGCSYTNQDFDILSRLFDRLRELQSAEREEAAPAAKPGPANNRQVIPLQVEQPIDREARELAETDHVGHGVGSIQQAAWGAAQETRLANAGSRLAEMEEITAAAAGFLHEDAAVRHREVAEELGKRIAVGLDGGVLNLHGLQEAHARIAGYHEMKSRELFGSDGQAAALAATLGPIRQEWRELCRAYRWEKDEAAHPRELESAYLAGLRDLASRMVPGEDSPEIWGMRLDLAEKAGMLDVVGVCSHEVERLQMEGVRTWLSGLLVPSALQRDPVQMTLEELHLAWARWEPLVEKAATFHPAPEEVDRARALAQKVKRHIRPESLTDAELVIYMRPAGV